MNWLSRLFGGKGEGEARASAEPAVPASLDPKVMTPAIMTSEIRAEVSALEARIEAGQLSRERVEVAAWLGHAAAGFATEREVSGPGAGLLGDWLKLAFEQADTPTRARAALVFVHECLRAPYSDLWEVARGPGRELVREGIRQAERAVLEGAGLPLLEVLESLETMIEHAEDPADMGYESLWAADVCGAASACLPREAKPELALLALASVAGCYENENQQTFYLTRWETSASPLEVNQRAREFLREALVPYLLEGRDTLREQVTLRQAAPAPREEKWP